MKDQEFFPCEILRPFIKCYWTCSHPMDVLEVMYPSGSMEFCIDISTCDTVRHRGNRSMKVPKLELLGHWTIPIRAVIKKGNTCLITRFHPYAGSLFFHGSASEFTNESIDLCDVFGRDSNDLYDRLMEQRSVQQKIVVLEEFLVRRLIMNKRGFDKFKLVESLCNHIDGAFNIQELAGQYGISERYIQKLFNEWVGLSPQKLFSVRRFNRSLELMRSSGKPLTSIAYECGYYDQAHFIKEFKGYTGLTPGQVGVV